MMIPATMIKSAAPRTAIAISPGEYFVSFFAGPACCGALFFFFFLCGFFDMVLLSYPSAVAAGLYGFSASPSHPHTAIRHEPL